MKIFSGTSHPEFAKGICEYLGISLGEAELSQFPNGETFVEIQENICGKDVFIVQSMHHPANQHFMELLIMIDAIRRTSASRITAVIPYFGYARQDRKDRPGVPITAKLIANLLVSAGTNRVLTMDIHAPQILGFFDIQTDHLSAEPIVIDYLKESKNYSNFVICSPDMGGIKMAATYADALDSSLSVIVKKRFNGMHVEVISVMGDVKGKDILLVDDMAETAETLTMAAKLLKEKGALSVQATVSHGALTPMGKEKLKNSSIDLFMTTNSTPIHFDPSISVITLDVCPLFGEAIRRIHSNIGMGN